MTTRSAGLSALQPGPVLPPPWATATLQQVKAHILIMENK